MNAVGFIVLLVLLVGLVALVCALLLSSLRRLLDDTVRVPAATTFYSRLLVLALVFVVLSAILGSPFKLEAGAAAMEYVWRIADGISDGLLGAVIFLSVYLIMVTVLIAALRRKNDE